MDTLSVKQVAGDMVRMNRTSTLHLNESGNIAGPVSKSEGSEFKDALMQALNGVNGEQQNAANLTQQMMVDPDSVNPHDLTIAMAKANLSLQMTKSVMDQAIKAYKEIVSFR